MTKSKEKSKNQHINVALAPDLQVKKHNYLLWGMLVFVIASALYVNTFHHGWVLDDYGSFKLNIYVTAGFDGFQDILTKTYRHGSGFYTDNLYRPFSQLMFATEWQFFPDSPGLYHAISVIFYALTCVLLFAFLRKLLKEYNPWIPLAIVLLYAAHPIHTEVVANIKSRDEIMCIFFVLLSMYWSVLYVDKQKLWYLPLVFVSFLLAMFSKESAITTLALLPVTLFFFRKPKIKDYIFTFLMLAIPAAIYLLVRHAVLANYPESDNFTVSIVDNYFYDSNLWTGWATAIMLLGQYLVKLFVPYTLVCDYSFSQFPTTTFADVSTWISLLIHLALLVYAIFGIKKRKPVAYAIFFYIITMSIFSNLVYRIGSSFADRFLFFPSLGFCFIIVFLLFKLFKLDTDVSEKKELNSKFKALATCCLLIFVLYSCRTVTRAAEWKDQFTLFGTDVKKSDKSAHMRLYWGLALRDKGQEFADANKKETNWVKIQNNDKDFYDWTWKAIKQFKKGVAIYPEYADCYEQLGLLYDKIGVKMGIQAYRDTAEYYYLQCLNYVPNKATANSNLAKIYFESNRVQLAKKYYLLAIMYDPLLSDGYFNLGSTYGTLAMYDSSFYYYDKCLQLDPKRVEAVVYKGLNYANTGRIDSAIVCYDQAIKMDSYLPSSYILKTKALVSIDKWEEAEKPIDEALSLFPYNGELYYYKGMMEKHRQNYTAALADMNSCIQYLPRFLEAYVEKYHLFVALGQMDSAKHYIDYVHYAASSN